CSPPFLVDDKYRGFSAAVAPAASAPPDASARRMCMDSRRGGALVCRKFFHREARMRPKSFTALWGTLTVLGSQTLRAQPQGQAVEEEIEVVGTTPLGALLDADRVASNVQRATAEDLERSAALDLADFMRRNLSSVFVNEAQNNPLQPDLQYRGFVGSPLLG